MKFLRALLALCVETFSGAVSAAEPVTLAPMPEALVARVRSSEAQIREQFQREVGHEPKTSHELLEWLDQKSLADKNLADKEKDELVQSYGAVLGQLLVHDLGGRWVINPSENSAGVDLPGGKVAFVFNRAARRIFDGDAIGFMSFFDTAASYAHGTTLPPGIGTKVDR